MKFIYSPFSCSSESSSSSSRKGKAPAEAQAQVADETQCDAPDENADADFDDSGYEYEAEQGEGEGEYAADEDSLGNASECDEGGEAYGQTVELAPNQMILTLSHSLLGQVRQVARAEGVAPLDFILELIAEGVTRRAFEDASRPAPSHLMTRTGYVPTEADGYQAPRMTHHYNQQGGNQGNYRGNNQQGGNQQGGNQQRRYGGRGGQNNNFGGGGGGGNQQGNRFNRNQKNRFNRGPK